VTSIPEALEVVAEALRAEGVAATLDPRTLAPPAVLVSAVALDPGHGMPCDATLTVQLTAVAPGSTPGDSARWLWGVAAPAIVTVVGAARLEASTFGDLPALTCNPLIGVNPWP
jgi:hypothetical protein